MTTKDTLKAGETFDKEILDIGKYLGCNEKELLFEIKEVLSGKMILDISEYEKMKSKMRQHKSDNQDPWGGSH